jgi:hypothetical protein
MRALGLVGVLLALLIVAWVAKDQLSVTQAHLPPVPGAGPANAAASVHDPAQQFEAQYKKAVDDAAKQNEKALKAAQ